MGLAEAYYYYGESLMAMNKIESVVLFNAFAEINIDTKDITEDSVEDPGKNCKTETAESHLGTTAKNAVVTMAANLNDIPRQDT